MGMTVDGLRRLLDARGIRYFQDPNRPVLLMNFTGMFGTYQVIMLIDVDGRFLQARTVGYASCPKSHPHCDVALQVLGALDYELRMTKWGWDPNDGEIVAYLDVWVEDGTVTDAQFQTLLAIYLPAIDLAHQRITTAMATGVDQGLPPVPTKTVQTV